jgi:hypothetical protein
MRIRTGNVCFGAWILAAALASALGPVQAQEAAAARPLFADPTPLSLTITAPIRELRGDDGDERPEHDGTLDYVDADGHAVTLDIKLNVRGKSRLGYCDFPPLKVDFEHEQVAGTVFAGQNELKLVTLCKPERSYRAYLAQEFLIYRMFNALTERSMRVRWAGIDYVDASGRKERSTSAPAFFIEQDSGVAERLGYEVLDISGQVLEDELDPAHTTLLALFQYMIANTDWDIYPAADEDHCCHNGKLMDDDDGTVYFLPYDFDQAGLIDTEYSTPSDRLPIRSVTRRYYRGFCQYNDEIRPTVAFLNSRRDRLEHVLDGTQFSRRDYGDVYGDARKFLERSYELLNDPDELESEILEDCR